ncbi:type II secretion system protein N [Marinimicrobium sp. ARAG 43.8]|uniref:type II secretion system protein N n=1 Tax=Marinimicrobium sp. ARAG 43.8 TaxID=3418719 RepID=UPI003CEDDDBA
MWDSISRFIPRLRWIVLLALFTVLFAITRIPATWAAHFMTQGSTLGLSGVTGTVWSGQARMASVRIDSNDYSLGALRWELNPWSVLTLRPCADVAADLEAQRIEGRVCAGLGGAVTVTDTSIDAPASLVQAGVPVPVDGLLAANIQRLRMNQGQLVELSGNLSWTNARIQVQERWVSLGSYAAEARYDPEPEALIADVFDLDAPVDIDVEARLPLAGGIFLNGELTLSDAFSDSLQAREWLPMVLEHRGSNRYRVNLQF